MKIGRVCGSVVSTISHPFLDGRRLLIIELLDPDGEPTGSEIIAIDAVDAGPGQLVLLIDEGNSARQILDASKAPVRTLIAGIIDRVDEDSGAR